MVLLEKSFSQTSIIWLILSAGIGGLIGSTIKYLFEQIISPRTNYKRNARYSLKRFSNPLMLSASSLARTTELYLKNLDKNWLCEDDDYFLLNILYSFGKYFGWCKIIEDKSLFEIDASITTGAKKFVTKFYRVYKGLNSFYYFENLLNNKPESICTIEKASVKRMDIQAIGELMAKFPENNSNDLPRVLSFTEFAGKYRNNKTFRSWFLPVLRVLQEAKNEPDNLFRCRLIIFLINLQSFINFYDSKSSITKKRSFDFLDTTMTDFKEKVLSELSKMDKKRIITTANK